VAVAATVVPLFASGGDAGGRIASAGPCIGPYSEIPRQGESCRLADGLWRVKLDDGTTLLTHGGDAPPPPGTGTRTARVLRTPVCGSSNPHGGYETQAIVAWPPNKTPNITSDELRSKIAEMNALFYASAVEAGSPDGADLVFACASGEVKVDRVRLRTSSGSASFSTIVSDLRRAGYTQSNKKYAIWYDDGGAFAHSSGYCGQGNIWPDERANASNNNNFGPSYSITYDDDYYDCGYATLFHELGHNLGAVQAGAPYSTGAYHCWQGEVFYSDVMCYNDGGSTDPGYLVDCGAVFHFDCGHNDYFDAKIGAGEGGGPGSYLDTNWNVGACYVRFVVVYSCPSPPGLTSFTPLFGPPGTIVAISGVFLEGATTVLFNGTPSTDFTAVSPGLINAAVPNGAKTGNISVTTPIGSATSAQKFTVQKANPPKIKSFAPDRGGAGTSVVITGGDLNGATAVKFNTTTASYTVNSPTTITATVPAGATTGKITVTTPLGSASTSKKFVVA
jgi:hypothetical protein